MNILINDCVLSIFKQIRDTHTHRNLSLINKQYYRLSFNWIYEISNMLCIKLIHQRMFNKVIDKYNYIYRINYYYYYNDETYENDLKSIHGCYYLNIASKQITAHGLKLLMNKCDYMINLDDVNISNEGFKYLAKYKKISLIGTNVSDENLYWLKDCDTIDLSETNITDKGLKYLTDCRSICLSDNIFITDEGVIKYLYNCKVLDLSCCAVTDKSLKYLTNCDKLVTSHCVTGKFLKYNNVFKKLDTGGNVFKTSNFKYLKSCTTLILQTCGLERMSGQIHNHLKNVCKSIEYEY